eukprot:TRINITY_DN47284_c0_g1_i1.p1 TRINITY_DN47284_c0_g1~~TRINITY_DN47284_c0_g1_i1.p1  ORF type:complete len:231 (-),score=27.02 TRINITY_DN47284_c0_g1_i1:68-760(-)
MVLPELPTGIVDDLSTSSSSNPVSEVESTTSGHLLRELMNAPPGADMRVIVRRFWADMEPANHLQATSDHMTFEDTANQEEWRRPRNYPSSSGIAGVQQRQQQPDNSFVGRGENSRSFSQTAPRPTQQSNILPALQRQTAGSQTAPRPTGQPGSQRNSQQQPDAPYMLQPATYTSDSSDSFGSLATSYRLPTGQPGSQLQPVSYTTDSSGSSGAMFAAGARRRRLVLDPL